MSLFYDNFSLPEPLSNDENIELLRDAQSGDYNAKEKLVIYNIRLVVNQVIRRFKTVPYDKEELVSVGIVGLICAINTFNITKNIYFSTYATKCIDNEILMFVRKIGKYNNDTSLDEEIFDDGSICLKDIISDDGCIEDDYILNEMCLIVKLVVNNLPEKEKNIVKLYYGFINDKLYSQQEISNILGIPRSTISKILSDSRNRIKLMIEEINVSNIYGVNNGNNCFKENIQKLKREKHF